MKVMAAHTHVWKVTIAAETCRRKLVTKVRSYFEGQCSVIRHGEEEPETRS
jgi:hypothetical protein